MLVSAIAIAAIPGIKVLGWSVLQQFGLAAAVVGMGALDCLGLVRHRSDAPTTTQEEEAACVAIETDPKARRATGNG